MWTFERQSKLLNFCISNEKIISLSRDFDFVNETFKFHVLFITCIWVQKIVKMERDLLIFAPYTGFLSLVTKLYKLYLSLFKFWTLSLK